MVESSAVGELWLRRFHPAAGAHARLVCLPHAGGSASFFFPVSKALSPGIEVLSAQYPGRQDRRHETPAGSVAELAETIAVALRGYTDKPLALFGHSMGAMVAFETARRLEADGVTVSTLFASGRRAPGCYRSESVHLRDNDGIVSELKLLSGTDTALLGDEEVLRMILPAIRADYHAVETYRCPPGPPLSCPITVLAGDADVTTTLDEARAWASYTTSRFALRTYSGGHFFVAHHQAAILSMIRRELAPALVTTPGA